MGKSGIIMKLRTKLKLAFCTMIVLPVLMCGCAIMGIIKYQNTAMQKLYGVDEAVSFDNMYSSSVIISKITDKISDYVKQVGMENPEKFTDIDYLKDLDRELMVRLSSLVVVKNDEIIYASESLESDELRDLIPKHTTVDGPYNESTYKGGEYNCIVKQFNFKEESGEVISVYIVTFLEQVIPQIKRIGVQGIISVIFILVITSLFLDLWIYGSIIIPLDRLKLATQNIKMGNLDFEMPKSSRDEIGDVCRDFEEMRVILKETSQEKIISDKEEKELIRNISHDLKTPLTAIKGYVEGIMDGVADTPEKQQRYLQTIANKVNDMDKLIDELTIYSKLDTNRVPYSFSRINLKDYFDDCCEEIRVDLEAQDIDLVYQCHNVDEVYIYADVEQLKRVINNIISNSVKYMKEGRKGRIEINLYDEGDYAHIIMTDNGMGIGTSDLPHIFDRFYRTDESRNSKQGGSGIGLAIVRKIIEDHKGKIWAESVEGEGTTMHICLRKDIDTSKYIMQGETKNE